MNIRQALFNHFRSRQPRRESQFPHYARVASVLVLYESEWLERNPEIRAIVQQLHAEDKQVVSWGYLKKDKILSPNLPESRVLGTHDFNLFCRPKSDVQQYLQRHEFDMLIDLTTTPVLSMQYVALLAKASFKIGTHDTGLYDMVIQCPPTADVAYLFQQITHYVKQIKSAD